MSKVNWVLAGMGDIARRRVIAAIQAEPRSNLYGFVTRDRAKARAYPGARAWATVEEAVADPAVDSVYIALPVAMHADAAIATLRAGKHVLCEKPMAMNFAQSEQMVAEARASGHLLGVSYDRRLYPKLIRARQLVKEGAIGRPLLAEANCHSWLDTEGRDWLRDPALAGGGPLYDTASHRIDAMNFLFGKVERACGLLSNAVHRMGVEDSATVLICNYRAACTAWSTCAGTRAWRGTSSESSARTARSISIRSTARSCAWQAAWRFCLRTRTCIIPWSRTLSMPFWPTIPAAWPAPPSKAPGWTGPSNRWPHRR